ncbi:Uncharacterised protein [Mycobacterium tuberculosis]|nr:Uncharacterised protein [Mycobacterium tuberculosis]
MARAAAPVEPAALVGNSLATAAPGGQAGPSPVRTVLAVLAEPAGPPG